MKNVVDASGNMDEFRYIVVVELELPEFEQVFDIPEVSGNEVIHTDDIITFLDEPVAQVRTQEAGCTRDEYSLSIHQPLHLF